MIGSVRGAVIDRTTGGEVLVEVGGVGYRVNVPLRAVPALAPGTNQRPKHAGLLRQPSQRRRSI